MNQKKKRREKLIKTITVIFLILVSLGFMVPGFLDFGDDSYSGYVEPRLCQTDSDCYLMCGEDGSEPQTVLCSNNLCQKNSCDEYNPYTFQSNPITFSLQVEDLDLETLINPNNLFVQYSSGNVQLYAADLSLNHVLEKIDYLFPVQMDLEINGEQSEYYGSYLPKEGDIIIISFDLLT